ncbi:N5-glutamine methyltransferase family protein [Corynebacterium heidelbergense]|uniref:Peptide chain release factor N(5)-glutamine methyltransferase n=1 Tax=Corynebacterium heidelbergense TaxID=2055947 RepID=A0A364VCD3_9CORY|nr:HemK/PrmC family methyltransferase [Corynebacterium heidelbergense]RAV34315.1 peptide chain release factor N(5)-glutamine methyltransferase [Corynebacterium heidelbergense]WCZ36906.1 Release factor glutamine methyltransferase [Corynebacterium heidelbergense]
MPHLQETDTVGGATRAAARLLADAGVESPLPDARLLMAYALAPAPDREHPRRPVSATELFTRSEDPAPAAFADWVDRRSRREPLQHIVGAAFFDGLDLLAGPEAFLPRPETELMVDWVWREVGGVLKNMQSAPLTAALMPDELTIVDLCTGPGSIALALAARLTRHSYRARIVGVDANSKALDLARANERQLRRRGEIGERVHLEWFSGDVADPGLIMRLGLTAAGDVVMSNPPYVPSESPVSPEVHADPAEAVFAGADGMALMEPLLGAMLQAAAPRCLLAIEHDDSTGEAMAQLLCSRGLRGVRGHRDLAGRDRFVSAEVHRPPTYVPGGSGGSLR